MVSCFKLESRNPEALMRARFEWRAALTGIEGGGNRHVTYVTSRRESAIGQGTPSTTAPIYPTEVIVC